MVMWEVEGGCPPYEGTLTAWYQDELQASMVLPLTESSGRMLDTPILHRGHWDRDYYLTITDSGGHRVHLVETITIGG
jgi:hypothetical protein